MPDLDKRRHAYRRDLADICLQGQVQADRFVVGKKMTVCVPSLALRAKPDARLSYLTQCLMGDVVEVFEQKNGWAWVKMFKDNYVGYVEQAGLCADQFAPSHFIKVPSTFIYPRANLKSQPAKRVFMNSHIEVISSNDGWSRLKQGGFVYTMHISPINEPAKDPVAIAEQFVHVPYLWGGNTADGLDCSALVQQAYHACALQCPRDSDMIETEIGQPGQNLLKRGDLVFWDGHIGMMCDAKNLIHANGHHMAVVIEDFKQAEQRISQTYGSTARFKRPEL